MVNLTGDLWSSLHMVPKHISPVWEQIHGAPWWTHAESPRGRWRHQFLDCLLPHDAADPPPSFHIVLIFTQRYFSMQCYYPFVDWTITDYCNGQWPQNMDLRGFLDILYCLTFTLFLGSHWLRCFTHAKTPFIANQLLKRRTTDTTHSDRYIL